MPFSKVALAASAFTALGSVTVRLNEPKIPYISNVTGTWITAGDATNPAYWAMHANHTARFSDALHELGQFKNPILLEAGPGRTLGVLAVQHPDRRGARTAARGRGAVGARSDDPRARVRARTRYS